MSHEIKIHEAQTSILRELLFLPSAGFSELQKPTGLTSDHFTFHINRLVELGLVERLASGKYRLTTAGKEYSNRLDTDERTMERQAKLAVLVVPKRERADGTAEYMLQRRLKHPFFGRVGFMSGKLRWGETVVQGARRELREETGLTADMELKCIYHKSDYSTEGDLLEDKHFYIMLATNPAGKFTQLFDGGENLWCKFDEIGSIENRFPGVEHVAEVTRQDSVSFWEQAYETKLEEY